MYQLGVLTTGLYMCSLLGSHYIVHFFCLYVTCFCLSQKAYQPKRKFKKPDSANEADEETQVSMTLLEYGRYGIGKSS